MKRSLLLLMLFLSYAACLAQGQEPDTTGLGNAISIPSITNSQQSDSVSSFTQRQVDSVNQIKVEYTKFAYAYRIKLYNWQLTSSKYIFAVVVIIVLIGLYLSYLQFNLSTKKVIKSIQKADEKFTESPAPTNKLEINKDGIKVDSAVIGLVILTISIVFFFLYLKFVFPINDAL
jgi:Ca2+/H+ antiporter